MPPQPTCAKLMRETEPFMCKEPTAAPILIRLALATAGAFIFAALPYSVRLDGAGLLHLEPAFAHADQGGGNSGPGGGDDSDSGGGGNSGPGGGDDSGSGGGGNSGPGGGDDDDDGRSGSGGSDDDDDDRGGGPGPDDGGGRSGSGGSAGGGSQQGAGCGNGSGSGAGQGACGPAHGGITRIEASRSGIEIRYADGAREGIRQGRYQRRDPQGRVVEDRRATGADVSRLRAVAQSATIENVAADADAAPVRAASADGREAEVRYSNGWAERIRGGRYELVDPYGRSVVRRPATAEDVARVAGAS
jgi:hypothetical protein